MISCQNQTTATPDSTDVQKAASCFTEPSSSEVDNVKIKDGRSHHEPWRGLSDITKRCSTELSLDGARKTREVAQNGNTCFLLTF